jgi:Bacterial Ig-like domain (group 3)
VTYALQDAAKHDPVFEAGNGIVNVFDLEGNFVRRFATGGHLDAPWGVTQASANFGPFSNDILIGNVGDGTINAFDLTTGTFAGEIKDGDGNAIVNSGLHGLTFRSDGFGDSNTLYFTAGINNGQDGLFGAITPGRVSTASVSAPSSRTDTPVPITVSVSAGPGNPGIPTGLIVVQDNGVAIAIVSLVNGEVVFPEVFSGSGTHVVEVRYAGDATFLPSSARTEVQVTGLATMLTLAAPANAAPGAGLTLTATANSAGGIPTGEIMFQDGNANLGTAPLDGAGVATFRINTLAVGVHFVVAFYSGDDKFDGGSSQAVAINVANPDFSLGAAPLAATVLAGQSTQFMLTVTPAGGFANSVGFSCSPVTGITCSFNPANVTLANGATSTTLTVTTSSGVSRYGILMLNPTGPAFLLAAVALFAFLVRRGGNLRSQRPIVLTSAAALTIFALSLTLGGCGGYGSSAQANRGTALINVTAHSGAISHSTALSVTVQ